MSNSIFNSEGIPGGQTAREPQDPMQQLFEAVSRTSLNETLLNPLQGIGDPATLDAALAGSLAHAGLPLEMVEAIQTFAPDADEELSPDTSEEDIHDWLEELFANSWNEADVLLKAMSHEDGTWKAGVAAALDPASYSGELPAEATVLYFEEYCRQNNIICDRKRVILAMVSMSPSPDNFMKLKDHNMTENPIQTLRDMARPTRDDSNCAYVRLQPDLMQPVEWSLCFEELAASEAYGDVPVVQEASTHLQGGRSVALVYAGETIGRKAERLREDNGIVFNKQLLGSGRKFSDYIETISTRGRVRNVRRLICAIYAYQHKHILKLGLPASTAQARHFNDLAVARWEVIGFGNKTADLWVNDLQEQILICFTERFNLNNALGGSLGFAPIEQKLCERLQGMENVWDRVGLVGDCPSLAGNGRDALMMDVYFTYAAQALGIPLPSNVQAEHLVDVLPDWESDDIELYIQSAYSIHAPPSAFPTVTLSAENELLEFSKRKPVLVAIGKSAAAGMVQVLRKYTYEQQELARLKKAGDIVSIALTDGRIVTLAWIHHPSSLRRHQDQVRARFFALTFAHVWESAQSRKPAQ